MNGHTILAEIDQIVGMQAVAAVDVHLVVNVFQHEYHACRCVGRSLGHGADPAGTGLQLRVVLGVFHQLHAEFVQAKVGDGYTRTHFLQIYDLCLQALQLAAAIFQIALFLRREQVVIAGGGHDQRLHAGLDPRFQIDVVIQCHIGPEIDELDAVIAAADTVDAPEALHQPHGIPMDVVVHKTVAVL